MKYKSFIDRLPSKERDRKTDYLYYLIHRYVSTNGQTFLNDSKLHKYLSAKGNITLLNETLRTHFQNMVKSGLLVSHNVISRYTEIGKLMLPLKMPLFLDDRHSPGKFKMYTLPGMVPKLK